MPERDLTLLLDAVRDAGEVAMRFTGPNAKTWQKDDGAGPVTEADLAVDKALHASLLGARPNYGWLSEETEDDAARLAADQVFVVDPIDGTRSFIEGSRTWAISAAVAEKGQVTAAAVYLPMRDLMFSAALGEGAQLNGAPLSVSGTASLNDARILAARPVTQDALWNNGAPAFDRHYRPSLAYRLSLVGQGRFDGMLTLRPTWEWDIAAGALIVTEAGGAVSDRNGAALRFNNPSAQVHGVVAAGRETHRDLVSALRPVAA